MKTLDEVIAELEDARVQVETGTGYWVDYRDNYELKTDALHYLQAYKDDRNDLTALRAYWAEQQANPALTWDKLCLMVGKPVWIEYDNHLEGRKRTKYKDWEVIDCILNDMCIVKGDFDYHKSELGKTWQAYRKERS